MTEREEQIRDMCARYSVEEMKQVCDQITAQMDHPEYGDNLTELQDEFDLWHGAMEHLAGNAGEAT